jgi:glutamate synthase (NADPH/NADH) large chain/glutamate synthase (ferredoxin)
MSGGVAFVHDPDGRLPDHLNADMVTLEPLADPEDVELVRSLLTGQADCAGSTVAARLLAGWDQAQAEFAKVMPNDLKRVIEARKAAEEVGVG